MTQSTTSIRTFFAIACDQAATQALFSFTAELQQQREFRRIKWQIPEKWHITLRFLGNTNASQIDSLCTQTRTVLTQLSPFTLQLTELQLFPSPHKPQLITLGALPIAPLATLNHHLEQIAIAHGLPAETRHYRPHLTLGRIFAHVPKINPEQRIRLVTSLDVNEVVLYQSTLPNANQPRQATYRVLEKFPF